MAQIQPLLTTTIFILYLKMLGLIQLTASSSSGFSLRLIPRDSPESPLYFGNISQSEKLERLVKLSKARVSNISPDNLRLGVSRDDLYYVVDTRIGTPWLPVFLIVDTGSSLTWTQCQPCVNCYHQIPPIYDSRTSLTYNPVPCNHPICLSDPNKFQCVNQKCLYNNAYSGGTVTRGILSKETFGFLRDINTTMVFGCSTDNQNIPFSYLGKITGVLGLSISSESLVQQLGNVINHRFSYCLIPSYQAPTASNFLRFGDEIPNPGRNVKSTPIVSPPGSYHYYLVLTDISVNGQRLRIPPGTFMLKRDGTGGFVIDSGSPATFIQQGAYDVVIRAFQNYFAGFGVRRHEGRYRGLELCYLYTPRYHSYASMTFHFQGADLIVDPEFVYLFDQHEGVFCVAILPTNSVSPSMLGAVHQQNTRFIYDVNRRMLQFASENCILDRGQHIKV